MSLCQDDFDVVWVNAGAAHVLANPYRRRSDSASWRRPCPAHRYPHDASQWDAGTGPSPRRVYHMEVHHMEHVHHFAGSSPDGAGLPGASDGPTAVRKPNGLRTAVGRRLTPGGGCCPAGAWPAGRRNHVSTRGADAYVDASTFSLTRPVDGRASDPEQVGELSGAVLTTFEESDQVRFLPMIQLGLLTTQAPLGLGDLHPFPGTQPNQIRTQPPSPAR